MKKVILFSAFIFGSISLQAQDFEEYCKIKFKTEEDYVEHEGKAIEAADYILATRLDDKGQMKEYASAFLLVWAINAPYTFEIWSWAAVLLKKNDGILMVQMSALVKVRLADKEADEQTVQENAAKIVYDYIKNPSFGVTPKGKMKDFVAAGDAGNLNTMVVK